MWRKTLPYERHRGFPVVGEQRQHGHGDCEQERERHNEGQQREDVRGELERRIAGAMPRRQRHLHGRQHNGDVRKDCQQRAGVASEVAAVRSVRAVAAHVAVLQMALPQAVDKVEAAEAQLAVVEAPVHVGVMPQVVRHAAAVAAAAAGPARIFVVALKRAGASAIR